MSLKHEFSLYLFTLTRRCYLNELDYIHTCHGEIDMHGNTCYELLLCLKINTYKLKYFTTKSKFRDLGQVGRLLLTRVLPANTINSTELNYNNQLA